MEYLWYDAVDFPMKRELKPFIAANVLLASIGCS
jgi:hypothetical protein